MKFIGESYSLYAKDIHQIWRRSAKFLWKSKFCSESGSGSWYYFGFKYQTYISYMEDTHQFLFGSANSFKSYCVHMKSPRTYVHPDRQTKHFFCLFCLLRYKNHEHLSIGENFFFHSCDYNTFSSYILCMWWESKNAKSYKIWTTIYISTKLCTKHRWIPCRSCKNFWLVNSCFAKINAIRSLVR